MGTANRKTHRPDRVLIRTKFTRPPGRPEFVERRGLLERLDRAVDQHRVTLISAPPGFGKTTVTTQWLALQQVPTAWLALDKSDSDPERFVRYLVAAIEEGTPQRLPMSTALAAARTPHPFDYQCEVLVSELAVAESRLVLVLDDYHTVESPEVHRLVERLVQTMPPSMHLLVLSRVDPPWPLGHWRAKGWLGDLRARDLRFSLDEARRFFAEERGAVLSSGTIEKLHARTEGWVAALRLVQLSLRGSTRPEERARAFSGTEHLVADYLMEEVLAFQPPEITRFLTVTAMLPRFSAPLCDHLLAGEATEPARETLARVLRLNLFLVTLDADGEWYRYHQLFQSLLLHHLPDLARRERREELDRSAAEWFAREGFVEEALAHLINAGAIDAAAELLGANVRAVLDGDMTRQILQRWLSMFPAGAERGRVPLLVAHAYFRMAKWDLRGMGELLDEAAQLLPVTAPRSSAPEVVRFDADVHALAAFVHYWTGNPTGAVEAGSRALIALPPRRGGIARWLATRYKAGALAITGRRPEALALLERAIEDASATEERGIAVLLLTQSVIHWFATELAAAAVAARRMLALHDATPIEPYHLGHAHHMLGLVAYAQNHLAAAQAEFGQVAEMRYQVNTRTYQDALIGLCLIAKANGDAAHVASYATEVRASALQAGDAVSLAIADWFDVRLTLDADDGPAAVSAPPAAADYMSFWIEVPSVTYAEALLRHPSPAVRESALPYIERSQEKVDTHHNVFQSIVFSLLRAQAHADRGARDAALDVLAAAVRQAEPSRLVRPFLDRGSRLTRLLQALATRDGRQGYLASLLDASEGGLATPAVERSSTPSAPGMSLSNRELDVLQLLTERLSNKEIADRLNVSSETVKKHTRNIYQKLDVHGRRDAVAKGVAERLISGHANSARADRR
jgi:LuxR family transcriptional regulator, maltose regulon positive regulatory protein